MPANTSNLPHVDASTISTLTNDHEDNMEGWRAGVSEMQLLLRNNWVRATGGALWDCMLSNVILAILADCSPQQLFACRGSLLIIKHTEQDTLLWQMHSSCGIHSFFGEAVVLLFSNNCLDGPRLQGCYSTVAPCGNLDRSVCQIWPHGSYHCEHWCSKIQYCHDKLVDAMWWVNDSIWWYEPNHTFQINDEFLPTSHSYK